MTIQFIADIATIQNSTFEDRDINIPTILQGNIMSGTPITLAKASSRTELLDFSLGLILGQQGDKWNALHHAANRINYSWEMHCEGIHDFAKPPTEKEEQAAYEQNKQQLAALFLGYAIGISQTCGKFKEVDSSLLFTKEAINMAFHSLGKELMEPGFSKEQQEKVKRYKEAWESVKAVEDALLPSNPDLHNRLLMLDDDIAALQERLTELTADEQDAQESAKILQLLHKCHDTTQEAREEARDANRQQKELLQTKKDIKNQLQQLHTEQILIISSIKKPSAQSTPATSMPV